MRHCWFEDLLHCLLVVLVAVLKLLMTLWPCLLNLPALQKHIKPTNFLVCMYVFVCVCVCEREREREREIYIDFHISFCMWRRVLSFLFSCGVTGIMTEALKESLGDLFEEIARAVQMICFFSISLFLCRSLHIFLFFFHFFSCLAQSTSFCHGGMVKLLMHLPLCIYKVSLKRHLAIST